MSSITNNFNREEHKKNINDINTTSHNVTTYEDNTHAINNLNFVVDIKSRLQGKKSTVSDKRAVFGAVGPSVFVSVPTTTSFGNAKSYGQGSSATASGTFNF